MSDLIGSEFMGREFMGSEFIEASLQSGHHQRLLCCR